MICFKQMMIMSVHTSAMSSFALIQFNIFTVGKVWIEEGLLYLFWSLRIGSLERFRRREMLVTGHLSEMPMGQQIHRPETTPSGSRDISLSPNMVPIWFPTNMVHNMVANMVPNMVHNMVVNMVPNMVPNEHGCRISFSF